MNQDDLDKGIIRAGLERLQPMNIIDLPEAIDNLNQSLVKLAALLEPWPTKVPVGKVFMWRGRMWRKGKGLIYVAHPSKDPTIQRGYHKRRKRREARAQRRENYLATLSTRHANHRADQPN